MKRLLLAVADLRAQVKLFFAEVRHDDALKVKAAAAEEVARSNATAVWTSVQLVRAREDADLASAQVRRHRQRLAVGLK